MSDADNVDVKAAYQRMADALRGDIVAGRLTPGQKIDSVRTLSSKYGVSQVTAMSAIRVLVDEGLLATSTGRGTYVTSGTPRPTAPSAETVALLMDRVTQLEARMQALEERLPSEDAD